MLNTYKYSNIHIQKVEQYAYPKEKRMLIQEPVHVSNSKHCHILHVRRRAPRAPHSAPANSKRLKTAPRVGWFKNPDIGCAPQKMLLRHYLSQRKRKTRFFRQYMGVPRLIKNYIGPNIKQKSNFPKNPTSAVIDFDLDGLNSKLAT